jgi:hypothetical protein
MILQPCSHRWTLSSRRPCEDNFQPIWQSDPDVENGLRFKDSVHRLQSFSNHRLLPTCESRWGHTLGDSECLQGLLVTCLSLIICLSAFSESFSMSCGFLLNFTSIRTALCVSSETRRISMSGLHDNFPALQFERETKEVNLINLFGSLSSDPWNLCLKALTGPLVHASRISFLPSTLG